MRLREEPWYWGCLTCNAFHHFPLKQAPRYPQPLDPSPPRSGRAAVDTANPPASGFPRPQGVPPVSWTPLLTLCFLSSPSKTTCPQALPQGLLCPLSRGPFAWSPAAVTRISHEPVARCKVFPTVAGLQGSCGKFSGWWVWGTYWLAFIISACVVIILNVTASLLLSPSHCLTVAWKMPCSNSERRRSVCHLTRPGSA